MGQDLPLASSGEDAEALMAEAKKLDTMFRANAAPATPDPKPDAALLESLCRALEREADGRLQSLDREHLLSLHKSLSTMRQQVERALKND